MATRQRPLQTSDLSALLLAGTLGTLLAGILFGGIILVLMVMFPGPGITEPDFVAAVEESVEGALDESISHDEKEKIRVRLAEAGATFFWDEMGGDPLEVARTSNGKYRAIWTENIVPGDGFILTGQAILDENFALIKPLGDAPPVDVDARYETTGKH